LRSDEHSEAARDATAKVSTANTNAPELDTGHQYSKQAKRSISAASLTQDDNFFDSPRAKSENNDVGSDDEKIEVLPPTDMAINGGSPVISPINSHESPESSEEEKLDWSIALTGDQFQHKQLVKFMNAVTDSEVFSGEIKVPSLSTTHYWIRVPNEHRKVFVKTFKQLTPEVTDVALERIQKLRYDRDVILMPFIDYQIRQLKHKHLAEILAYSEEPLTVISECMKNGKC